MALIDKRIPYEILFRFGEDGTFQAAHVGYRRYVELDGEVLKNEELPVEPLTVDSDFPTSALMGEVTQAALSAANELITLVDEKGAEIAKLREALEQRQGVKPMPSEAGATADEAVKG